MIKQFDTPLEQSKDMLHKRFDFTPDEIRSIKRYAKNSLMSDYDFEDIDIDQVAQDNDLDHDTSMAERRANWWGNDINKYSIKPESLKRSYITDPIRIKVRDGKMMIADGHHRLKALKNMGYTTIPAFIKK